MHISENETAQNAALLTTQNPLVSKRSTSNFSTFLYVKMLSMPINRA